jgi:Domain of unknown function (DUF4082)
MKKILFAAALILTIAAHGQTPLKANDGKAIEAGMVVTLTDSISGAQFYKPPVNKWVINIYDSVGNLLDSTVSDTTYNGWVAVSFAHTYPAGKYTISYYSASGDYSYTPNYFLADSAWIGYKVSKGGGVYKYGRGLPTSSYNNNCYQIWPVLNPVSFSFTPDTMMTALIVVVNPDGSPVRLPDGTTATKLLLGFDPPGPMLETFLRYSGGVMYRYTLYKYGTKREKRVGNTWVDAPY